MIELHFVQADGSTRSVRAEAGLSLMQTALNHSVPGILGDCGGSCSCATCHVFIEEAWRERGGSPTELEAAMLECTAVPAEPGSRLACQITVTEALNGMVIRLPPSQV
jgi:2Fe-2S ferredoxin